MPGCTKRNAPHKRQQCEARQRIQNITVDAGLPRAESPNFKKGPLQMAGVVADHVDAKARHDLTKNVDQTRVLRYGMRGTVGIVVIKNGSWHTDEDGQQLYVL